MKELKCLGVLVGIVLLAAGSRPAEGVPVGLGVRVRIQRMNGQSDFSSSDRLTASSGSLTLERIGNLELETNSALSDVTEEASLLALSLADERESIGRIYGFGLHGHGVLEKAMPGAFDAGLAIGRNRGPGEADTEGIAHIVRQVAGAKPSLDRNLAMLSSHVRDQIIPYAIGNYYCPVGF